MKAMFLKLTMLLSVAELSAHEWNRHDEPQFGALYALTETERAIIAEEKLALAENSTTEIASAQRIAVPSIPFTSTFGAFAPKVRTRMDDHWFYVESDGLPAHNMMVGITAWQQQVPLPQPYVGANAWRIPLHPVVSKNPVSIRGRFLRGAIALAANGIPIFNPQNNRGEISADNWFIMFINGQLAAVDSIAFIPHNVVTADILPEYPLTIAIMAKDNTDPKTGLEYGDHIGDGGIIIKFADGTVSNAKWKAKNFFKGPLNQDVQNPKVAYTPVPTNWFAVDFDDSAWGHAVEYTEERVNPKEPFYNADFGGAKFIWTDDLDLDNTVIFRTRLEKPGWKPRWNTKPELDVSGAPSR